jgi:glycosyltransferase involved in cell wall biosynthesis
MKIALFTDGIYPYVIGGMQKHSFYLAKYFARAKVHVDLYHCNPGNIQADELHLFSESERQFIRAFEIPFPRMNSLPGHYIRESYSYSCKVYEAFLKNPDVDFIYAKGFSAWKLIDAKRKGAQLPPVGVNFHGLEMFQEAPDFRSKLEQHLLRSPVRFNLTHADHVFSYGGEITALLKAIGVPQKKIIAVPTGIEQTWLADGVRVSNGHRRFIFVGRNERRKGIHELNAVLKELREPGIAINFVGPIPASKQLKLHGVTYAGAVMEAEQMKQLMDRADVLVCPSHSEGMPNVIMEAMARGLAIIATDVGAVSEMVDKENGWLIGAHDKKALQDAIQEAEKLPSERLDFKKQASIRRVKERFLWESLIEDTIRKIELSLNRS